MAPGSLQAKVDNCSRKEGDQYIAETLMTLTIICLSTGVDCSQPLNVCQRYRVIEGTWKASSLKLRSLDHHFAAEESLGQCWQHHKVEKSACSASITRFE